MGQFRDGVRKLGRIALEDPIARLVMKLVFHKELMPPMSRQQWESAINTRPIIKEFLEDKLSRIDMSDPAFIKAKKEAIIEYDATPKHTLSEEKLVHHLTTYYLSQRDQGTWSQEVGGALFTHAVAAQSNHSDISIAPMYVELKANTQPVWKAIKKEVLYGPDDWNRVLDALADHHYEETGEDLVTHQHRCNSRIPVSISNIVRGTRN